MIDSTVAIYLIVVVSVIYSVAIVAVVKKLNKRIKNLVYDNKDLLHNIINMKWEQQRKFVFPVETKITPYDIAKTNGEYVDYVSRKIIQSFADSVVKHYEKQLLTRIKDTLYSVTAETMFGNPAGVTIRVCIPAFRIIPEEINATIKKNERGEYYGMCGNLRNNMEVD